MRQCLALVMIAASSALGCVSTTKLDHVVIAYDTTTQDSISTLLLLNIARARQNQPMHFTAISSVVATYRFTVGGGARSWSRATSTS